MKGMPLEIYLTFTF